MGSGIIATSLSGLQAAQLALSTTDHNIANANTAGFTRQRTVQASNPGQQTGAGFVGRGTHVATIERVYSRFLTEQVNRSQSKASDLDTYYAQIKQIDNMLADPTTGLSPALQDFFASVQQLAANPAQLSSRQALLSTAQSLSARYQSLGKQLAEIGDSINGEIKAAVSGINSYADQIGILNQQIGFAEAASGQPANDLLDSRDQLVAELNKLIKAKTTSNSDGSVNVFIGSGQQLVVGTQVSHLATLPSASDPAHLTVGLKTASGTQEIPESLLGGGNLGGLLAFRAQSLDPASNDLGRNAASLALTFNAQSELGQDLYGHSQIAAGSPGFTPKLFAVAAPAVIANTGNPTGSPALTAAFVSPPPFNGNFYTDLGSSDYQLAADAGNGTLTLTRLADHKQWQGADLAAINAQLTTDPQGFVLASDTPLSAGSSYLIQPTRDAARQLAINPLLASDAGLITAAGPIRSSLGAANSGSARISAGQVGPGYAAAVQGILPITLEYRGGSLRNFPVGAQVSIDGAVPVAISTPTDAIPYTSGASITLVGSVDSKPPVGVSFSITGLPNDGDLFSIGSNPGAIADGRNALSLGQLQTQNTMTGQTASFQAAYAQLVSEVGSRTRQAQVSGDAQQTLLEQAQSSRDAVSAVNLDEEAANLIRYQQAYQASAKAMQISASLFDTILQIAG